MIETMARQALIRTLIEYTNHRTKVENKEYEVAAFKLATFINHAYTNRIKQALISFGEYCQKNITPLIMRLHTQLVAAGYIKPEQHHRHHKRPKFKVTRYRGPRKRP